MKDPSSTPDAQRSTFNSQEKDVRYDLEERLLEFAARIIRIVDALPSSRAGNHIAGQLIRSGTSPLPNHGEAQAAESRADFIHKLKICLKELRETRRWLRLIARAELIQPASKVDALLATCEELIRIFFTSLRTAASAASESELRVREGDPDDPSTLSVERWMLNVEPPAGPPSQQEATP